MRRYQRFARKCHIISTIIKLKAFVTSVKLIIPVGYPFRVTHVKPNWQADLDQNQCSN